MSLQTPAQSTSAARPAAKMPSAVAIGLHRGVLELKQFARERRAVVFTLAFPVILLVIFGSVFDSDIEGTDVPFTQYFVSGMIAAGLLTTSFQNLAITIAEERDDGTLKRLAGTPMPKISYFIGKIVLVGATSLFQAAVLLTLGTVFFGINLPADATRWFTFAWVTVLGVTACTLAGIAFSSLARSGRSAPAVVSPVVIVLEFISGVFFVYGDLPSWMRQIASFFPLKWMTQGMRSVFLPDSFQANEVGGSWDHGRIALVLLVWIAVGLVLCLRTFRWKGRE